MKYSIVIPFLSLFLIHCSHTQKQMEKETVPSTCKLDPLPKDAEKNHSKESIMWAIFEGDAKKVKDLISKGHDIHATDALGFSYLHLAAGVGNPEIIEILIGAGLPVNGQSGKKKSTPAHSAVRWGKLISLETLAKHGANFSLTDAHGKTPADLAKEIDHQPILNYLKNKSITLQ